MGRPLFTRTHVAVVAPPSPLPPADTSLNQPEKWSRANAFDPDSDEFWAENRVVYEAFVEPATQEIPVTTVHVTSEAQQTLEPADSASVDDGSSGGSVFSDISRSVSPAEVERSASVEVHYHRQPDDATDSEHETADRNPAQPRTALAELAQMLARAQRSSDRYPTSSGNDVDTDMDPSTHTRQHNRRRVRAMTISTFRAPELEADNPVVLPAPPRAPRIPYAQLAPYQPHQFPTYNWTRALASQQTIH